MTQQRKCPNCPETAVDGELVVMYDVNREEKAGELEVGENRLEKNRHAEAKLKVLVGQAPGFWEPPNCRGKCPVTEKGLKSYFP